MVLPWLRCLGHDLRRIAGDAAALRRLLERDPNLSRYNQPIHFAAREGHIEALRLLLDAVQTLTRSSMVTTR